MTGVKTFLKKSQTVHSIYKLMRDSGEVPRGKWLQFEEMTTVFKVLPNTMLPLPRLFGAFEAVRKINEEGIAGDIVECGVWNGGCVGLMAVANSKTGGPRRKFHLFDSFEGLPQPSRHDIDVVAGFKAKYPQAVLNGDSKSELWAIGACVGNSQPSVERFLVERLKIDRDDLVFHKGWFQDTVPNSGTSIQKIALLRIDGDWYDSTKVCLEGLFHKVAQNGFVIIDDYGTFSGCRKASDEFFDQREVRPELMYSDSDCVFFRKRHLVDEPRISTFGAAT